MDGQQSKNVPTGDPQPFKPGDTISPGTEAKEPVAPDSNVAPAPAADNHPRSAEASSQTPVTADAPAPLVDSAADQTPISNQPATPADVPPVVEAVSQQLAANPSTITWTASEFIAHDKSASWYGALALAVLALAALVYLFTRDKISTGVVVVAGVALGGYGARKPRQLQYELNDQGVTIGPKFYAYNNFRSFAILDEGAFLSIAFTPLNRFGQLVTIYFDPKQEGLIVDLLADRLPLEERGHDVIDRFMKRIRF